MQLVFATNNKNKLKEIRAILKGSEIEVLSLLDINLNAEIPEPFDTLEENAMAKASYVKTHTGYDCFADDTGLEIAALNGLPGVRSARFAGEPANSARNIDKVLKEMNNHEDRSARFRTSIALILAKKKYFFEGIVNGKITRELHGNAGFGYDPIFIPEGFDKTFAEMSAEEKNSISHRGIAVQKLTDFLKSKNYG
jgi:XTP/dITP diphosphohydrolase